MMWRAAWIVWLKELTDALRDRRTLLAVMLSSVVLGPVVLVAMSQLVTREERRAEAREALAAGLDAAPTLRNYIERQGYTVKPAPADYAQAMREGRLDDAVLVVPPDFEAELAAGRSPRLELVSSSDSTRSDGAAARWEQLVGGFLREQTTLRLAMRGISAQLLDVARLESRDLADRSARAARLTRMLPFFVLMAVLYGALTAALDTTAGERERGSLEPLMMNPAPSIALVAGKWGAVAAVGMLVAVLSSISFIPARWLIRSESLNSMVQYGWREAALFVALLVPLAAALSALMMAIAIRCRSFKEAQATTNLLVLGVSLLPMVSLFGDDRSSAWQLWVPALAQMSLMGQVLKGDPLSATQVLLPLAVALAVTAACLVVLARQVRQAAVR